MEGISEHVQRKLEQVFEDAKDLAVETVLAGWDRKTPLHFSQIEAGARRLAGLWSCHIQEWAAREMTAQTPDTAACPSCGEVCSLELEARTIQSTDGPVPILEWKGTCTRCRRKRSLAEHDPAGDASGRHGTGGVAGRRRNPGAGPGS